MDFIYSYSECVFWFLVSSKYLCLSDVASVHGVPAVLSASHDTIAQINPANAFMLLLHYKSLWVREFIK